MNEAIRNIARRKLRTSLTILGIVIGVFALTVMGALAEKLNVLVSGGDEYFRTRIFVFDAGAASGFQASSRPITRDLVDRIEAVEGVDRATPVMQTLATLIIDGILERHPRLMFGVIEQGASWLPSWMRYLDSAHAAFVRMEERLQALSLKPSEYVRRQIRATPYPAEDVGWIMREAGAEVPLFSSDYPHVEGGRNPVKRFESTLGEASDEDHDRFYRFNFESLMGRGLAA